MADKGLTLIATGDLVLEMPNADRYFFSIKSVLQTADLVISTEQAEGALHVGMEGLANEGNRSASLHS